MTRGPVASYRSGKASGALRLPARSVHVPVTDALRLSGRAYVAVVQAPIPDTASVPPNTKPTGARYQPLESGGRLGVATVACGALLSIRTVAVYHDHCPETSTPHNQFVTPSAVSSLAIGQLSLSMTAGLGYQLSTTSLACQPLQSGAPGEQVYWITCADAVLVASRSPTTATRRTMARRVRIESSGQQLAPDAIGLRQEQQGRGRHREHRERAADDQPVAIARSGAHWLSRRRRARRRLEQLLGHRRRHCVARTRGRDVLLARRLGGMCAGRRACRGRGSR